MRVAAFLLLVLCILNAACSTESICDSSELDSNCKSYCVMFNRQYDDCLAAGASFCDRLYNECSMPFTECMCPNGKYYEAGCYFDIDACQCRVGAEPCE